MLDDLPYLVSEINSRLLYDLGLFEEDQLLNGNGTSPNLRGLLQRSGIQTETGAAGGADNLDAIFRAATKVQTATGLNADGIVIHPTDYQVFRLKKDGNQQYYAGGPFTGAYGNSGGVPIQPALWGLPTVVTAAIAAGTVLVGAFGQSTTVYRKGGVTVSSTNSNVNDFEKNLVTVRAEERLALAVRVPAALVKVTLGV
jgi:HK97 family phage major capsid protein